MNLIDFIKLALDKHSASSKFSEIFKAITATGTQVKPQGPKTHMPKPPKPPMPKMPKPPKVPMPVKSTMPQSLDGADLMPDISRAKRLTPMQPPSQPHE